MLTLKRLLFLLFFSSAPLSAGQLFLSHGILKPHDPRVYFNVEYKGFLPKCSHFRSVVGVMTEEAESLYVYGGIAFDFFWFGKLVFTPSFAPGLYFANGGVNLGFPIEFRSAIEFGYEPCYGIRTGFLVFHLSNAHLSHKNPGVNGCGFFVAFPF